MDAAEQIRKYQTILQSYMSKHRHTLLNAAVIFVVYVVGISARFHASVATVMRINAWFGITPEVMVILFVLSVIGMASASFGMKYLSLMPLALYAMVSFAYALTTENLTLVAGLQHPGMLVLMSYMVRVEQKESAPDG